MENRKAVPEKRSLSRPTLALWVVAAYFAMLYVSFRWGLHPPPKNLFPSAD